MQYEYIVSSLRKRMANEQTHSLFQFVDYSSLHATTKQQTGIVIGTSNFRSKREPKKK